MLDIKNRPGLAKKSRRTNLQSSVVGFSPFDVVGFCVSTEKRGMRLRRTSEL